jgi:hypothetical protein
MITINKNTSNLVALTLTEKSLLTGDTYNLFVFTNQSTGVEKVFTATDTSMYKQRYNQFEITESATTENLLSGLIHMTGNTSEWTYSVYESSTPFSSNTLSITATTGTILEIGRVQLNGQEGDNNINQIYL